MPVDASMLSMESRLALLSPEQRAEALQGLDLQALQWSWEYTGRPDQLQVISSLSPLILMSTGRGSGKTRTGSEWIRDKITNKPYDTKLRFSLTARTIGDVRDVMIQGESGLESVFPPSQRCQYIASQRKVLFHDGSEAHMFTSIEPSLLRGPQFHYSWADELAAWKHIPDDSGLTAWDNLQIATRLGDNPQLFVSTTPKRTKVIRLLYARATAGKGVHLITGASTYDNPHLSSAYFETLTGLYAGTRLAEQELHAIMLEDVEGALWRLADIEADRDENLPAVNLRVVGVDPSVADKPGDECGIVVVGSSTEQSPIKRHAWVMADMSVLGAPAVWARRAVEAAHSFGAPIVAEKNQGGAMVREMIHQVDPTIPVKLVTARVGKALRAEPVTLAYDQHRVHHMEEFPELEDQMTTWVPGESSDSPDRVDALVHALTALVVPQSYKAGVGPMRVTAPRGQISLVGGRSAQGTNLGTIRR